MKKNHNQCWMKCKSFVNNSDCSDYIKICLGDTFVTMLELERMVNIDIEKNEGSDEHEKI